MMNILNDESLSNDEKIEDICFYGTLANHIDTSKLSDEQMKIVNSAKKDVSDLDRDELGEFSNVN